MSVIRTIMIFLIGAGFALGTYISGIMNRVPGAMDYLWHLRIVHAEEAAEAAAANAAAGPEPSVSQLAEGPAPITVQLSSPAVHCAPAYRITNNTSSDVLLSIGSGQGSSGVNGVKIPPGGTLDPSDTGRTAAECPGAVVDVDMEARDDAAYGFPHSRAVPLLADPHAPPDPPVPSVPLLPADPR